MRHQLLLNDMGVPTREECVSIMTKEGMPSHIIQHSFAVCTVATKLAKLCLIKNYPISFEMVEAGALLHDIAKAKCIEEGCHHAIVGAEIVKNYGYFKIAPIVERHVTISLEDLERCPNEAVLVNYADKRVLHTEIVSLDERFADLIKRYGKSSESKFILEQKWKLYKQLEDRLCNLLGVDVSSLDFYQ